MASPTPPIQVAFLSVLLGTWIAGCLGPVHALAWCILAAVIARMVLAVRGLTPAPFLLPVVLLALVAALRLAIVGDGRLELPSMVGQGEPTTARVRVERVVRRSDRGTTALGEVLAVRTGPGWVDFEPPLPVTLRHAGLLPVPGFHEAVVRGRFRPQRAPSPAVSPGWPDPIPPPTLAVSRAGDWVMLAGPRGVRSRLDGLRLSLALRLRGALDGDVRDLVIAVLLGEGGGIDPALREDLSVLGTAHVLAVSGLHVAAAASLVGLMVFGLFGPWWIRRSPGANLVRIALLAAAAAAAGMALMAGGTPSATRAAIMCGIGAVAACVGRRQTLASLAALAGLAGLLRDPHVAFSVSFLMSYGAVFALAFLVPPLTAAWTRRREAAREGPGAPGRLLRHAGNALAASIAATIGTLPATVLVFGVAAPLGPLVNLLVLPTAALLLMPCALLLAGVAALFPLALPAVATPVSALLGAWLTAQQWLSRHLPSSAWVAGPTAQMALLSGAAALACWLVTRRLRAALLAGMVVLALLASRPSPPAVPRGAVAVTFLDVGKGDAALVHCRDGDVWLIDAAEARAALGFGGLVPTMRALGVTRLAGILLTHADEDHVGGTEAVLRAFPVDRIVTSCPAVDHEPLAGILASARAAGIDVSCRVAGDTALPGCADASPVLWPPPGPPADRNAASLVFRLEAGRHAVLMTGDLEAPQEAVLLASGADVSAEVLKLGHHGSPGASSSAFLRAVAPNRVVASGIPVRGRPALSPDLLERLSAAGAPHLSRTFKAGWVRIGPWKVGQID
jgi:competence protein ComEC